jgi:sugar transferase (PEP-CTERM/EpsH1 system associated)
MLAAFEKQVARHVDLSLFVSEAEAATFRSIAGSYGHSVDTLHNGVDLEYFRPDAAFEHVKGEGSPSLVFTGAMDYRPNVDAVRWFAADVLPLVRRRFPHAGLTIVGSNPTPDVVALGKRNGILVTGRVPDVRPYIAAADVSVAPIRIARGIQNTVLEAMAMGRPIVASEAAFEGIEAERETDLLVRNSAPEFAGAICDIVCDPALAAALGARARARVTANYAWETQLRKLDRYLALPRLNEAAA